MAIVIWERYLEHATALGVADEVEKQVVALRAAAEVGCTRPGPAGRRDRRRSRPRHAFDTSAPSLW